LLGGNEVVINIRPQAKGPYFWEQRAMEISPEHFLNELLGYQKTAALKAAIELDLFSALAAADGDLGQVSERTGASERGIRILCDYLTVRGYRAAD
jgi:hypothetical protein